MLRLEREGPDGRSQAAPSTLCTKIFIAVANPEDTHTHKSRMI